MSTGFRLHAERERSLGGRKATRPRPSTHGIEAGWLALSTLSLLAALLFAAVAGCPP